MTHKLDNNLSKHVKSMFRQLSKSMNVLIVLGCCVLVMLLLGRSFTPEDSNDLIKLARVAV